MGMQSDANGTITMNRRWNVLERTLSFSCCLLVFVLVGCIDEPAYEEREEFVRRYVESVVADTSFHRAYTPKDDLSYYQSHEYREKVVEGFTVTGENRNALNSWDYSIAFENGTIGLVEVVYDKDLEKPVWARLRLTAGGRFENRRRGVRFCWGNPLV